MDLAIILSIIIIVLIIIIVIKLFSQNNNNNDLLKKDLEMMMAKTIQDNNDKVLQVLQASKDSYQKAINDLSFELLQSSKNNQLSLNKTLSIFKEEILDKQHTNAKEMHGLLSSSFEKSLRSNTESFDKVNQTVSKRLEDITLEMNRKIEKSFEKTNTSFASMIERLAKIDEAQNKIEKLSSSVLDLQGVLTNKNTRGIYGEIQLGNILRNVFGEPGKAYQEQYVLSNNSRVDAIIMVAEPVYPICIDSKFPLENYQRMIDTQEDINRSVFEKAFKQDLKKHIDDISSKYIIEGETSTSAIMFIPAEAIFAYIHAYLSDMVEYAQKKNVWIASPTTLMAIASSIQVYMKNIEANEYTKEIHMHLNKLRDEFKRYELRWDKLHKDIGKVNEDAYQFNITTDKISKEFNKITELEFDREELDLIEQNEIN